MKSVVLMICFVLSVSIHAVTMDEYLVRLEESHPLFKQEDAQVNSITYQTEALRGVQDWQFNLSPSYLKQENITFTQFSPDKFTQYGLTSSLNKSIWGTGGQFSFDVETNKNELNIPLTGLQKYHQHVFSLSYTHPLLRNHAGIGTKFQHKLAKLDEKRQELIALENKENFLVEVSHKFIDWVSLEEQLSILKDQVELSKKQLNQTKRKFKDNLVDKVDIYRSEDLFYRSEQAYVKVLSARNVARNECSIIIQDDSWLNEYPEYNLFDFSEQIFDPYRFDEFSSFRVLSLIDLARKQNQLAIRFLHNKKQAQLNLVFSGSMKTAGDNASNAFKEDFKKDYFVGAVYEKSLGETTSKNELKKAEEEKIFLDETFQLTKLNLEASLRRLEYEMSAMRQVLDLNRKQIKSASQKTLQEIELYNQGRSQLNVVIQAQDNQKNLRITYAQNAGSYQKMILSYLGIIDKIKRD